MRRAETVPRSGNLPSPSGYEFESCLVARRPSALAALPALLADFAAGIGAPVQRHLIDVGLDTPDLFLARAGVALRVRFENDTAETTLKSLVPMGEAPTLRMELNRTARQTRTRAASPPQLASRFLTKVGVTRRLGLQRPNLPLKELFRLEQSRTVYPLTLHDETRLQVSADTVTCSAFPGHRPLHEIEIELLGGSPQEVSRLSRHLQACLGLAAATRSKHEYGLSWAGLSIPTHPDPLPYGSRRTPLPRIAAQFIQYQFDLMTWHEPGVRLGFNPDYVHRMRVATRRLRAALRLFDQLLPQRCSATVLKDLEWLADGLGQVRDADVHLARAWTWQGTGRPLDGNPVTQYRAYLIRQRRQAFHRLSRMLGSARYTQLRNRFSDMLAHLESHDNRLGAPREELVRLVANLTLPLLRSIRHAGRSLQPGCSDEAIHRLRIRCKRLRYACECFARVRGCDLSATIQALARLQNALGRHQDRVTEYERLRQCIAFLRDRQALGRPSAWKALLRAQRREIRCSRKRAIKAWHRFDSGKPGRTLKASLLVG